LVYGGVSANLACEIRFIPRDSLIGGGPTFFHVSVTTQAATNDVTYFFASQNVQEFRAMDYTGIGGTIYNLVALPRIVLEEDWQIQLTNIGGVGDVVNYLIYYTEVDV